MVTHYSLHDKHSVDNSIVSNKSRSYKLSSYSFYSRSLKNSRLKCKKEKCDLLQSILIFHKSFLNMQRFNPPKQTLHICILPSRKHDSCARSRSDKEGGTIHACCLMPPRSIKYSCFTTHWPESLYIKGSNHKSRLAPALTTYTNVIICELDQHHVPVFTHSGLV